MNENRSKAIGNTRRRLHEIIFEADTPGGRLFDAALIVSIVISVILVIHLMI